MFIGEVIGSVWATQKETGMENLKLLVVKSMSWGRDVEGEVVIAVDRIGSGVGEKVIVTQGSPARKVSENAPIDAAVVGIVDSLDVM